MKISAILSAINEFAPPVYQESYDNAQLITGNPNWECTGALLTLDAIEVIVDEAIEQNCNLIIAHHPIVFSGLKSLTGKNYIERTIIKAIKNDIAIFACHTNIDNVVLGVNHKIAAKLNLQNAKILAPKSKLLYKLFTYVPINAVDSVRDALFAAGAGAIGNYDECSFQTLGKGSFKGNDASNPTIGERNIRHYEEEAKLEVLLPEHLKSKVIEVLKAAHPYEEVAYELIQTENVHQNIGSGMIGELAEPMPSKEFLQLLQSTFKAQGIRYTDLVKDKIQKVALCGGAGSFLLSHAIRQHADIFITGDYKYHQFFDADGKIIIADIGHYESEQYTSELFYEILSQKFSTFAVRLSKHNTNPINYL